MKKKKEWKPKYIGDIQGMCNMERRDRLRRALAPPPNLFIKNYIKILESYLRQNNKVKINYGKKRKNN